jgi:hypothetical protein
MTTHSKKNALTRETLLALLTDAEVAKVSVAEDAPRLIEGDEYVDLADPTAGVQQVQATPRTPPGHALPRSAVSDGDLGEDRSGRGELEGRRPPDRVIVHAARDVTATRHVHRLQRSQSAMLHAFRTSALQHPPSERTGNDPEETRSAWRG